jgi:hypothetical protein
MLALLDRLGLRATALAGLEPADDNGNLIPT